MKVHTKLMNGKMNIILTNTQKSSSFHSVGELIVHCAWLCGSYSVLAFFRHPT